MVSLMYDTKGEMNIPNVRWRLHLCLTRSSTFVFVKRKFIKFIANKLSAFHLNNDKERGTKHEGTCFRVTLLAKGNFPHVDLNLLASDVGFFMWFDMIIQDNDQ